MISTNKVLSLALALFINAGVITACSQQAPNTPADQNQSSGLGLPGQTNTTGVNTNTSANTNAVQVADASEVQANMQDDEITVKDSEDIANSDNSFATKALGDRVIVKSQAKVTVNVTKKILGKNEREKIVKERENVVKAQLKLVEAKLKLLKAVDKAKIAKLKRKDVDVNTSDTQTIENADGTTSKIIDIKFDNKVESRENKMIKTFDASGKLIKLEHYITVTGKEFTRTYSRIADFDTDGSRKVVISSETKWANGRSRTVNEERNINADGSGTGTGTVVITDKNGKTTTYEINITIKAGGDIVVNPVPTPTPSPSVSPTASSSPVASSSPSATPVPSATATATASPTATPVPSDSPSPTASPVPSESPSPIVSASVTVQI